MTITVIQAEQVKESTAKNESAKEPQNVLTLTFCVNSIGTEHCLASLDGLNVLVQDKARAHCSVRASRASRRPVQLDYHLDPLDFVGTRTVVSLLYLARQRPWALGR
jgi:hypothetical protein